MKKIKLTYRKIKESIKKFNPILFISFTVLIALIRLYEWVIDKFDTKCPECGSSMERWSSNRYDCNSCGHTEYIN